jgi:hypothetical protein
VTAAGEGEVYDTRSGSRGVAEVVGGKV